MYSVGSKFMPFFLLGSIKLFYCGEQKSRQLYDDAYLNQNWMRMRMRSKLFWFCNT